MFVFNLPCFLGSFKDSCPDRMVLDYSVDVFGLWICHLGKLHPGPLTTII